MLPAKKLHGAWLSRDSHAHWLLAFMAAALYLTFFMFLASDGSAEPTHVLVVGLFTATFGVGILLLVQTIAENGPLFIGRGILALISLVLKFIAFSYQAANDKQYGFFVSFLAFTFGVGLCEELVKSLPLFWHRKCERGKTWRGLFIWGLASGAGFGIAEGVMYSGELYNGIFGPGVYGVRFLSCVALHAIWTGSVGITLYLRRDSFNAIDSWPGYIGAVLTVIAVPMVLHGLYDTCLKREMYSIALLVAAASFGWLAFLTSRLYGTDDEDATQAMLKEYKKRRRALSQA
jgi:RsiW-degrading membrane proteinase PrsW (M82 family)